MIYRFKQTLNRNIFSQSYITYLFLGIQTVIFLLMEVMYLGQGGSLNSEALITFGSLQPNLVVVNNEWWRLITPIFIHIGWQHFIINSLTLYFLGSQVEKIFGHLRFFGIYLLAGVAGNALSFAMRDGYGLSAGASTSLFGLFATYIVIARIYRENPLVKELARTYGMLIVLNLVMNIFDTGVDIWGHIGGVVGGLLISNVVSIPQARNRENIHFRIICGMVYVFFLVVCIALGWQKV